MIKSLLFPLYLIFLKIYSWIFCEQFCDFYWLFWQFSLILWTILALFVNYCNELFSAFYFIYPGSDEFFGGFLLFKLSFFGVKQVQILGQKIVVFPTHTSAQTTLVCFRVDFFFDYFGSIFSISDRTLVDFCSALTSGANVFQFWQLYEVWSLCWPKFCAFPFGCFILFSQNPNKPVLGLFEALVRIIHSKLF